MTSFGYRINKFVLLRFSIISRDYFFRREREREGEIWTVDKFWQSVIFADVYYVRMETWKQKKANVLIQGRHTEKKGKIIDDNLPFPKCYDLSLGWATRGHSIMAREGARQGAVPSFDQAQLCGAVQGTAWISCSKVCDRCVEEEIQTVFSAVLFVDHLKCAIEGESSLLQLILVLVNTNSHDAFYSRQHVGLTIT